MYSLGDVEINKKGIIDAIVVLWDDLGLIGRSNASGTMVSGTINSVWFDVANDFEQRANSSEFELKEYNTLLALVSLYTIFDSYPEDPLSHSLNANLPVGISGDVAHFLADDEGKKSLLRSKDMVGSLAGAEMGVKFFEGFKRNRSRQSKDASAQLGHPSTKAVEVAEETTLAPASSVGAEEQLPPVVEHVTIQFDDKKTDALVLKRFEMLKQDRIRAEEFYDDVVRISDRSSVSLRLKDGIKTENGESGYKSVGKINEYLMEKARALATQRLRDEGVVLSNSENLIPNSYLINLLLFQYLGEPTDVVMPESDRLVNMMIRVEEQRLSALEQALMAMRIDIENLNDNQEASTEAMKKLSKTTESTKRISAFHLGERMGLGDRPRQISDIDPYNDGIESLVNHVDDVVGKETQKKYEKEHRM